MRIIIPVAGRKGQALAGGFPALFQALTQGGLRNAQQPGGKGLIVIGAHQRLGDQLFDRVLNGG